MRLRSELSLGRQSKGERARAGERENPDHGDAAAPAHDVGERRAGQTSGHAPERVAGDVEAHREPDRRAIHLLGQISHRHRWNARERKAGQRPKPDQRRPVRRKEAANVAAAAAAKEAVMTALRPNASDSAPAQNIATANTPVAADNERLAAAGEIEKARAKPGIMGWTQ